MHQRILPVCRQLSALLQLAGLRAVLRQRVFLQCLLRWIWTDQRQLSALLHDSSRVHILFFCFDVHPVSGRLLPQQFYLPTLQLTQLLDLQSLLSSSLPDLQLWLLPSQLVMSALLSDRLSVLQLQPLSYLLDRLLLI